MKCYNCGKLGHISPECMAPKKECHKEMHEYNHAIKEIEPSVNDEADDATLETFDRSELDDDDSDDESLDLNLNRMCLTPGECNGNAANANEFSKQKSNSSIDSNDQQEPLNVNNNNSHKQQKNNKLNKKYCEDNSSKPNNTTESLNPILKKRRLNSNEPPAHEKMLYCRSYH